MASIVKARLLRTGTANWSASSDDTDEWIVEVDEQISKAQMTELWLSGPYPKPNGSFKQVAVAFLQCDKLAISVVDKQRFIWKVVVYWKEFAGSESIRTETRPTPNSDDPEDWRPTVTRRPVTVTEPAQQLYYEGGYNGKVHDEYEANTEATPPKRSPVTNSARVPFEDNLPPHQRKQSLYTIRWLRDRVPIALVNAELALNDRAIKFSHRGYEVTWQPKTVKIESVQITQTKWGKLDMWEIVCELLEDSDGHIMTTLDMGMAEQYFPGETYSGAPLSACKTVLIKVQGKPSPEPALLNGAGKRLDCEDPAKFGKWRDFELVDFNGLPLLGDLVSNVVTA